MTEFSKKCPGCNNDLYYTNKYKLQRSIKDNATCGSCANRRRIISEDTRRRMSSWIRSNSMRKKISESLTGNPHYRSRIGIPLSVERKRKISERMTGRTLSLDHRHHISDKLRGRKLSPTHIMNSMIGQEKSVYRRKPYNLGNKVIMTQGYENITLDKLISEGISPENIKTITPEKPRVEYFWNGKNRWYYPDCYIKSSNTIVETKSDWTWKADLDKNLSKIKSSQGCGHNVRVIVWNGKRELVSDTMYNGYD